MRDVSGPPLLVAWGRWKCSWDSEDQTSAFAANWLLWSSRRTKRPKKMKCFWSASGLFFPSSLVFFAALLTFSFFARISQPLRHKEREMSFLKLPLDLSFYWLDRLFKLGVDFSFRTAFLLLYCAASSMIFFFLESWSLLFLFSLSTVKQIWIIHFDERNCKSACPAYRHMYLPDGAIQGAAVALTDGKLFLNKWIGGMRAHTVWRRDSLAVCCCPFPPRKTHLVGQQWLDLSQLYILQLIHLPVYPRKPTCSSQKRKTTHETLLYFNGILQTHGWLINLRWSDKSVPS